MQRSDQSAWSDILNRRKFQDIENDFHFKCHLGQHSLKFKLIGPVSERPKTYV